MPLTFSKINASAATPGSSAVPPGIVAVPPVGTEAIASASGTPLSQLTGSSQSPLPPCHTVLQAPSPSLWLELQSLKAGMS